MNRTKKAKLEMFDALDRSQNLLIRYFWDSRENVKPEVTAKYRTPSGDRLRASVYRTDLASGGYIVIDANPGIPSIAWYEDWTRDVAAMPFDGSEFTTAVKTLMEQVRRELSTRETKQALESMGVQS